MIEDAGDGGKLIGRDLVQAAALGQPDRTGGSGSHSIPVASANVRWRSTPAHVDCVPQSRSWKHISVLRCRDGPADCVFWDTPCRKRATMSAVGEAAAYSLWQIAPMVPTAYRQSHELPCPEASWLRGHRGGTWG